jgi:hypothetical protein
MERFILNIMPRSHIERAQFEGVCLLPAHLRMNFIIDGHVHRIHNKIALSILMDYILTQLVKEIVTVILLPELRVSERKHSNSLVVRNATG